MFQTFIGSGSLVQGVKRHWSWRGSLIGRKSGSYTKRKGRVYHYNYRVAYASSARTYIVYVLYIGSEGKHVVNGQWLKYIVKNFSFAGEAK